MTPERILEALQETGLQAQTIGQRYAGQLNMFQAACLENNGQQSDEYRQNLHVLLDLLLDNIATSQMLQRQFLQHRR